MRCFLRRRTVAVCRGVARTAATLGAALRETVFEPAFHTTARALTKSFAVGESWMRAWGARSCSANRSAQTRSQPRRVHASRLRTCGYAQRGSPRPRRSSTQLRSRKSRSRSGVHKGKGKGKGKEKSGTFVVRCFLLPSLYPSFFLCFILSPPPTRLALALVLTCIDRSYRSGMGTVFPTCAESRSRGARDDGVAARRAATLPFCLPPCASFAVTPLFHRVLH